MNKIILALVALFTFTVSSCAPLAITGLALVITDEWKENALTAVVNDDVDLVWPAVRSSVSEMTDALLHVDEDHRTLSTRIDNAVVTVHVKEYAVGESRIYVDAKKYMVANPEVADLVMNRLVKDLNR